MGSELAHGWLHIDIRRVQAVPQRDKLPGENLHRTHHKLSIAGFPAIRVGGGFTRDIHRNGQIAIPAQMIDRQRVDDTAIHQKPPVNPWACNHPRNGNAGRHGLPQRTRRQHHLLAQIKIRRRHAESDPQLFQFIWHAFGQHQPRQCLAIDEGGTETLKLQQIEGPAAGKHPPCSLHARAQHLQRMRADFQPPHARRIGRPHKGSHAGARNAVNLKAHLIQHFEHGNMPKPTRRTAAKG